MVLPIVYDKSKFLFQFVIKITTTGMDTPHKNIFYQKLAVWWLQILLSTCYILSSAVITVGYEFTTYTTSEGQGSVELSIIVSNFPTVGAPRPFTLSVSTENGSAGMALS